MTTQKRWDSLTSEQKRKFIPLAPDFEREIRRIHFGL